MMMTAIKKSQIVAATVAVIAMSAVATPSHARTVKAAAKKTTTVTTTRVAPKTTTIVNQHSDGTSDTVMVRPNGFTIVDGMPFYPTQIVTTPTYRTVSTSTSTPVVTTTAPVITTAPITTLPSTTVVSTSNVNTTVPVTTAPAIIVNP